MSQSTSVSESLPTVISERIILLVLTAIQFTNILDFVIMMPLGPQLMRIFAISPQEFGFVVSAYTFSAGVSRFLAAFFLANHFGWHAPFLFLASAALSSSFPPAWPRLAAG